MKRSLGVSTGALLALLAVPPGAWAGTAADESSAVLDAIRTRAEASSGRAFTRAENRLVGSIVKVDAQASVEEDEVAARLASEFATTPQALHDEKQRLVHTGWGDLMIAHILASSSARPVTVEQLVALHGEGMEWSRIAAAIGFTLSELVAAANTEGRVAIGLQTSRGKPPVLHGPGSKFGYGSTTTTADATTSPRAK